MKKIEHQNLNMYLIFKKTSINIEISNEQRRSPKITRNLFVGLWKI